MSKHLIDLPAAERDEFSFRPLVSKHRIHDLNLVGDDELIALLDAHPRERLQPSRWEQTGVGATTGTTWIRRRPPGRRSSRRCCAAGSG